MKTIYEKLIKILESYLTEREINSVIIGFEDSPEFFVSAALCKEVCGKLHIPLYGVEDIASDFSYGKVFCDFTIEPEDLLGDTGHNIIARCANIIFPQINSVESRGIFENTFIDRFKMSLIKSISTILDGNSIIVDLENKTEHYLDPRKSHGELGIVGGLYQNQVDKLFDYIKNDYKERKETYLYEEFTNNPITRESTEQIDELLHYLVKGDANEKYQGKQYSEEEVSDIMLKLKRSKVQRNYSKLKVIDCILSRVIEND